MGPSKALRAFSAPTILTLGLNMKLLILTLVLFPCLVLASEEKIGDKTVNVSEENRVMNAAIAEARRTLDQFLRIHKNPPQGASNFKLKVMLSDDSGVEHVWFSPFKEIEGGFSGVLVNEPSVVKSVEYGKVYAFKREQITDWGYVLDDVQYGSYTVCALFKFMDKRIVEQYKKDHGFICQP